MTVLTAAAIEKFKPTDTIRRIRDEKTTALFLIVTPTGHKSFQMRFRVPGGKISKLTLGPVDMTGDTIGEPQVGQPLSLVAARQLAASVLRDRAMGKDPAAAHKAEKRRARTIAAEQATNTFGAAAIEFAINYTNKKKSRQPRQWARVVRNLGVEYDGEKATIIPNGLADRWADVPLASVSEDDIFVVVNEARRDGIPGLQARTKGASNARGRKMVDVLSSLFRWLKRERRIKTNPLADCEWRPPGGGTRTRRLSDHEIRWVWAALGELSDAGEVPAGYAAFVKFLLVTATRRNEALLMTDNEVNGDDWIVPKDRVKADVEHLVPLSPLARRIMTTAPRGQSPLIFTHGRDCPMLGKVSACKALLDARMLKLARMEHGKDATIEPWTLHDFRRNARTFLARVASVDVAEKCLGHVVGGVRKHYDLYKYRDEKAAALEAWAHEIERIVEGKSATVVPIGRRK